MQPIQKPRAQRFPIQIPMRYRPSGEPAWSEATTVNISHSGVLLHAEKALEPQTALEMLMELPTEIAGEMPANVICYGPVVRSDPPFAAVSIVHYRFAPAPTPLTIKHMEEHRKTPKKTKKRSVR